MTKKLFTGIQVGDLELKHRVVMAPMTRLRAPDHVPDAALVSEFYGQRAQRPGTLLITEATFVHAQAGGMANVPGLYNEEQINAWSEVVKAVHEKGSHLFIQLWGLGRQAFPDVVAAERIRVTAPSPVRISDNDGPPPYWAQGLSAEEIDQRDIVPHALTKDEIKEYIGWFVQAAKNAIAAGADGIEIHGANGFIVDQFLHPNSNTRTDEYGGSIENNARFVLELVEALSDAIGPSKVGLRLSPWSDFGNVSFDGSPVPQFSYIVNELEAQRKKGKGIAYIHIIEPRLDLADDTFAPEVPFQLNSFVGQIWSGPVIRSGNLTSNAVEFAETDDQTLIAIGRYFISNPDVVDKLEKGAELNKYDRSTFYTPGAAGYTDYPTAV